MDAQMASETNTLGVFSWDFFIDTAQGIVPMITGANEDSQEASIAVFLTKDSTPQLAGSGQYVDWLGFFTEKISFGELDANIRQSLNNAGQSKFTPSYSMNNGQLQVAVVEGT